MVWKGEGRGSYAAAYKEVEHGSLTQQLMVLVVGVVNWAVSVECLSQQKSFYSSFSVHAAQSSSALADLYLRTWGVGKGGCEPAVPFLPP